MANVIKFKRSSTPGAAPTLSEGEIAVNLVDKRLFTANSSAVFDAIQNTASNFSITGTSVFLKVGNSTVNLVANSTSIKLANSSVNTGIRLPTSEQYSGNYFLHANGSWVEVEAGGSLEETRVYQKFVADPDQSIFTVSGGYSNGNIDVYYNGVHLSSDDYTQDGEKIYLSVNAVAGAIVEVVGFRDAEIIEYDFPVVTRVYQKFVAEASQNTFTVTNGFSNNNVDVYYNGVHLSSDDYTQDGSKIYLNVNAIAGSIIEVVGVREVQMIDFDYEIGGLNTQILFNDSNMANGSAGFTFSKTTNTVSIANTLDVGTILNVGANVSVNTTILKIGDSSTNTVLSNETLTLANSTVSFAITKPTSAQVSNGSYFLASDSTWKVIEVPDISAGGSNTQVQFNDEGSFGGSAGLTFSKTSNNLSVANSISTTTVLANTLTITNDIAANNITAVNTVSAGSLEVDSLEVESLTVSSNTLSLGSSDASANGYTYLPNGLLLQWGKANANSSFVGGTVSFPIPFPNECFAVTLAPERNIHHNSYIPRLNSTPNTTAMQLRTGNSSTITVHWMAIGR